MCNWHMTTPLHETKVSEFQPLWKSKYVILYGSFKCQPAWTNHMIFSLTVIHCFCILVIFAYFLELKFQQIFDICASPYPNSHTNEKNMCVHMQSCANLGHRPCRFFSLTFQLAWALSIINSLKYTHDTPFFVMITFNFSKKIIVVSILRLHVTTTYYQNFTMSILYYHAHLNKCKPLTYQWMWSGYILCKHGKK